MLSFAATVGVPYQSSAFNAGRVLRVITQGANCISFNVWMSHHYLDSNCSIAAITANDTRLVTRRISATVGAALRNAGKALSSDQEAFFSKERS